MKEHFNKNFIMSEEEEYLFQQSNSCWICKKLINNDEQKVRDHCHVTGKFTGAAHWSCNINFKLTKRIFIIFHNLKGYDSYLVFSVLHKFDVKISVIPNGLEKYMAFFVGKNLDLFERFITTCLKYYKLDPCHYFSSPGLSWDAMPNMTGIKLEKITDIDKYLFIEKGTKGGVPYIVKRYDKANNKYINDYNPEEPSTFITFLDKNNLYG